MNRLFFLVSVFFSIPAFSQSLPLNFQSYAIKLCVAGDESLAMTTRAGEVGLSQSMRADWREASPEKSFLGPTLDQPNFFNKDTGFVSGFISGTNDKYNIIYHTVNGGQAWKAIDFGQDGWVDDAINLPNGEAWMSVSGSGIAYTNDYGFTWRKIKIPEIRQRFAAIYFNSRREGIIGSLWNMLAYTPDNGESWKLLPTPLDQKKYSKTNKESRPEFDRVAMFGNYLLAKQEELVFYTRKDSIEWTWLKAYDDFYTDPENSAIYFKTTDDRVVRCDEQLKAVHTYQQKVKGYDAKCRNGSLFIVTNSAMVRLQPDNTIQSSVFKTSGETTIDPALIGHSSEGGIGVLHNQLFIQKEYDEPWKPLGLLPLSADPGQLSVVAPDRILYTSPGDSLLYFDFAGKITAVKSKRRMMEDFQKAGIREIIFESGSQGCFHHYADELTYTRAGDVFAHPVGKSSGSENSVSLPDHEDEIQAKLVSDFIARLPQLFDSTKMATIDELGFSQEEYDQCKKDIRAFQASLAQDKKGHTSFAFYKNNLDFDRLLSLVDSVRTISKENLHEMLFNLSELWSTTSFWRKIVLVGYNNDRLTIHNSYYEDNAFGFPWKVNLNDHGFITTNMEIYRFINKVYPSWLPRKQRVAVLHRLVKALY